MSSPHFNLLSTPRHPDPAKDKWATDYVNLKGNYLVLAEGSEQIEDEESSQTEKFEKGAYNCLGWATNKQEILGHWSFWEKDALKQRFEEMELHECKKEEATIAIYYLRGEGYVHVAFKHPQHGWTSKMGITDPLITHEQDAIDGGPYFGTAEWWFGPKASSSSSRKFAVEPEAKRSLAVHVDEEDLATVHELAADINTLPALVVRQLAVAGPTKPPTKAPAKAPTSAKTPPTNPAAAAFEKAHAAWAKSWKDRKVNASNTYAGYMKSAEYKALIKLGAAILPLLAARLAKGNILDVIPYTDLDKKIPVAGMYAQKMAILKGSAAQHRQLKALVGSFSTHRDNVLSLSGSIGGLDDASKLLSDPLFLEIVRTGAPAVVHVLKDYATSGVHGKAIWEEALKEIHQLESENLKHNDPEAAKEFETWLESYTGLSKGQIEGQVEGKDVQQGQPQQEEQAGVEQPQ